MHVTLMWAWLWWSIYYDKCHTTEEWSMKREQCSLSHDKIYSTTVIFIILVISWVSHNLVCDTWLSRPSMINMKKKQMDQNGAAGIFATAAGYTMNANPGPTCNTVPVHCNDQWEHQTSRHSVNILRPIRCSDTVAVAAGWALGLQKLNDEVLEWLWGMRCKWLAYRAANTTAIPSSLWLIFQYRCTQVILEKGRETVVAVRSAQVFQGILLTCAMQKIVYITCICRFVVTRGS